MLMIKIFFCVFCSSAVCILARSRSPYWNWNQSCHHSILSQAKGIVSCASFPSADEIYDAAISSPLSPLSWSTVSCVCLHSIRRSRNSPREGVSVLSIDAIEPVCWVVWVGEKRAALADFERFTLPN